MSVLVEMAVRRSQAATPPRCACGATATVVMLYGDPTGAPWASNIWCPTHAAEPQALAIHSTVPLEGPR